jgi:hypothetical protein
MNNINVGDIFVGDRVNLYLLILEDLGENYYGEKNYKILYIQDQETSILGKYTIEYVYRKLGSS